MTEPSAAPVLVIKHGALGDFVLATGCFAAIRRHHTRARLVLLTTARFAALARERATPDAFREAGERLLDSHDRDAEHPPCAVRLARLNISPDDVRASVLTVAPDDAAIDLIEGHEALEMELCRDYQVDMFLELAEIGEMLNGLFEQSGRQGMKRH